MGKVNTVKLAAAMARVPEALTSETRRALQMSFAAFDSRFQRERLNGRPGLIPRSGRLRQSMQGAVTGRTLGDLTARYGTNVKYAPIHEFGGYRKIPTGSKTPAGVQRSSGGATKRGYIKPRLRMFKTWEEHIDRDLMPRVSAAVDRALAK